MGYIKGYVGNLCLEHNDCVLLRRDLVPAGGVHAPLSRVRSGHINGHGLEFDGPNNRIVEIGLPAAWRPGSIGITEHGFLIGATAWCVLADAVRFPEQDGEA